MIRGLHRKWVLWLVAASGAVALVRAAEPSVTVIHDVRYLEPGREEKLDVYLPAATPAKPTPAIVWIHGGGWKTGTKNEARAKEICTTLARAGYVAVSIDYLLGEGAWPQNLLDCKNAVRFLRANARDYHVDVDRIAVAGGSAGGHLALMVGLTAPAREIEPAVPYPEQSGTVRCIIDLYGPADLRVPPESSPDAASWKAMRSLMSASTRAVFGATTRDAGVLRTASPVTHIMRSSPPVLILHGRSDPTVDYSQSALLARALEERDVPHELVLLPEVGHTFDLETWNKKPLPRDLRPVVLAFLRKHLGEPSAAAP